MYARVIIGYAALISGIVTFLLTIPDCLGLIVAGAGITTLIWDKLPKGE